MNSRSASSFSGG